MSIESKINTDFITAFKAKNMILKNILGVVRGEMQTLKKNLMVDELSDEKSIKILMKFSNGLKNNLLMESGNTPENVYELSIIESYLPKQLSESDIREIVQKLIDNGITNIGMVMKEFSSLLADKKLVSDIFKELSV